MVVPAREAPVPRKAQLLLRKLEADRLMRFAKALAQRSRKKRNAGRKGPNGEGDHGAATLQRRPGNWPNHPRAGRLLPMRWMPRRGTRFRD